MKRKIKSIDELVIVFNALQTLSEYGYITTNEYDAVCSHLDEIALNKNFLFKAIYSSGYVPSPAKGSTPNNTPIPDEDMDDSSEYEDEESSSDDSDWGDSWDEDESSDED